MASSPNPASALRALLERSPLAPDWLTNCNRCGFCLAVCPTYRETGLEAQSPRGRLALVSALAAGELPSSPYLRDRLDYCLDCRACQTACPAGVPVGEVVVAARAILDAGKPLPLQKRLLLRGLLPNQKRLEQATRGLGLGRLLPGDMGRLARWMPAARPRRIAIPQVMPPQGNQRYRVGFFLGCAMNLFFPEASQASLELLATCGAEVVLPQGVSCCGAPHHASGDTAGALALARRNIDAFAGDKFDAIVTDCAACGATLKEYGHLLKDDPGYAEPARLFSAQVQDLSEFLSDHLDSPDEKPAELARRVTYHDPCHLAHAQGIRTQPRQLLRSIPGLELVELGEADACCGSAGPYVADHFEMSMGILRRKLDNIASTGAETVVTANPGCLIHLGYGLRKTGGAVRVVHLSQVLAEAYRRKPGPGQSTKSA